MKKKKKEQDSRVAHSQYDRPCATASTAGGRFRP